MIRMKTKKKELEVAVIVDFMGSSMASPEQEIAEYKKQFSEILNGLSLKFSTPRCVMPDLSADLVIYDFGGLMPGSSLMEDNSRQMVQWASDHPSGMVVIVSSFTFSNFIKPEMEELGLDKMKNIVNFHDGDREEEIRIWFGRPGV